MALCFCVFAKGFVFLLAFGFVLFPFTLGLVLLFCASFFFLQVIFFIQVCFRKGFVLCAMFFLGGGVRFFKGVCFVFSKRFLFFQKLFSFFMRFVFFFKEFFFVQGFFS